MKLRSEYPNRAAWRTARSQERRAAKTRIDDLRERVEDDLTTYTIHPTKGFRRISGRRIEAQAKIPFFTARWAQIAAVVR
jgi:hypothetical protein